MQEETDSIFPDARTEESIPLSELLQEKMLYEYTHTDKPKEDGIDVDSAIVGSALAEEHEMYIAQTMLSFTPGITPTLTPGFTGNHFTLTSTS